MVLLMTSKSCLSLSYLITTGKFRSACMSFNTTSASAFCRMFLPLFFAIFLKKRCSSDTLISGLFLLSFIRSAKCRVNSTSISNLANNLSANFSRSLICFCVTSSFNPLKLSISYDSFLLERACFKRCISA